MTISSLVRKADMDEESSDLGSARSVFIKSFGCQMNVYDADRMMDLFSSRGYSASQDEAAADVVVLNTCHIREKAAEKVFSELGRLRELKDEKKVSWEESENSCCRMCCSGGGQRDPAASASS